MTLCLIHGTGSQERIARHVLPPGVRVRVRKLVVDEDNIDGGLSLGLVA